MEVVMAEPDPLPGQRARPQRSPPPPGQRARPQHQQGARPPRAAHTPRKWKHCVFRFGKSQAAGPSQKVAPPSDLNFSHAVHEYLQSKLCSRYNNDCIFDNSKCCWNGSDRSAQRDETLEAPRENGRPQASLQLRRVCAGR
ncbi:serine/threonine-protein phosphatase 2A 55 kDa regulatory subunit B delta isoform isoform X2 [Muntiacus reevesi]|uniref:serine/threonine-protein phosphatase 2A 55 kDa regulatory subunit B delta isoform isoform X2 n=1 Tax=Muntiacus reevesi TaxID=9886 RepID=UPI0033075EA8